MRIGVDARALTLTSAGISGYTRAIVSSLAKAGAEVYAYSSSLFTIGPAMEHKGINLRVLRFPCYEGLLENVWQSYILKKAIKQDKIDVFIGMRFWIPERIHCPGVAVIHDVAFKKYPELVRPWTSVKFDRIMRKVVFSADHIVAVSKTTRDDIVEQYGCDPTKITAIYSGGDEYFNMQEIDLRQVDEVKTRYGIRGKFVMTAGTIEPRKNIANLIRAYKLSGLKDTQLVVAGAWGWMYEEVQQVVDELQLTDKVVFTGYVTKQDLKCLYSSCEAFALASWYEGFGFPVLEAMRCGAVVVTSDNSSLKELFCECSLQAPADRPDLLAVQIKRAVLDIDERKRLRTAASEHCQRFSWDKTAEQFLELLNVVGTYS